MCKLAVSLAQHKSENTTFDTQQEKTDRTWLPSVMDLDNVGSFPPKKKMVRIVLEQLHSADQPLTWKVFQPALSYSQIFH